MILGMHVTIIFALLAIIDLAWLTGKNKKEIQSLKGDLDELTDRMRKSHKIIIDLKDMLNMAVLQKDVYDQLRTVERDISRPSWTISNLRKRYQNIQGLF